MVKIGLKARRLALAAGISAAAGVGVCLLALAIAPALVPQGEVRRAATEALAASSGRDVRIEGESRFSLVPYPRIVLQRVTLAMPGTSALESEQVVARLRLLPLLLGRADVSSVTLRRPILTMSGAVEVPHLSLAPFVRTPTAPSLRIEDGTIAWRDSGGLTQELVSGISARLDHSSGGKGLSASADFTWRDKTTSGRLTVADASAFLDGMDSDTRLDLFSDGATLKFRGVAAAGANPAAEGDIALDSPDLRSVLNWVGTTPPTSGGFGRFSFGARLSAHGREISLTPAYVEMDGNRGEGGLTLKLDGRRPSVEGTFAADAMNITPYGRKSLTGNGGRDWDHGHLDVSLLHKADLDLRLSANSIRADDSLFERVASSVVLRGGRLLASVGEAQAWGGLLRATLSVAPAEAPAHGTAVRVEMDGNGVALEKALGDIADIRRLEGKGDIQASISGQGDSIYAIAQSLGGAFSVKASAGAIVGLDVAQALRHLEQRPLSGGGDVRGGRTSFTTMEAKAQIVDGKATLDTARITGRQVQLQLAGSVSVADRTLDLKGDASLVNGSGEGTKFELPFIVQGTWDNAFVMPDAQSLIRRSGAAQPLLDAVRSRGGDAAVRSVIEQISKPSPLLPTGAKTAN